MSDQHGAAPGRGIDSGDPPDGWSSGDGAGGLGRDGSADVGTGRGFGVAYAFLNRRERTEAEVRARLIRAEIPAPEVELVVAELLELGYVDDARYARVFAQDKRSLEAWGSARIRRALRERGVERELIEQALLETAAGGELGEPGAAVALGEDAPPGEDTVPGELGRAVALLERRFPGGPAEPRDQTRAFGVLARKGYESETAADAVREWVRRRAG